MSEGHMTADQAEKCVWRFYWQLFRSRDRRITPIRHEPPDVLEQRRAEFEEQEKRVSLFTRIVDGVAGLLRKREVAEAALADIAGQREADRDLTGLVDKATGLPLSSNDLGSGRSVITSHNLVLGAILSPTDIAAASCAWLPPCPGDESPDSWGQEESHWQVMAYKPHDVDCPECEGKGTVTDRGSAFIYVRERKRRCESCRGRGKVDNWSDEEIAIVRHNALEVKLVVHRLAEEGLFNLRPLNERDQEVSDLVWEDEAGFSLGIKLTYKGLKRMEDFIKTDETMRRHIHILEYAGRDIRKDSPGWAQDEYREATGGKL